MRLSREDYRNAVGILKRFNYNCLSIMDIRNDIISIGAAPITDMPKVPYGIGDTTLAKVIEMEENKQLQKCVKEYKIVMKAIKLVNEDSKYIFEEMFRKGSTKWDIIDSGMSERTYFRRKHDLIEKVDEELKNWQ